MNDTTTTDVTTDDSKSMPVDVAVQTLVDTIDDLATTVNTIQTALSNGMFKYLSKGTRNELFDKLLEQAGATEDTTKAVFRQLKKVKRERIPEQLTDNLIVGVRPHA